MKITRACLTGILILVACSDPSGTADPSGPSYEAGITLSGPVARSDTIGAVIADPVVVEVGDDNGQPVAGVDVRLTTQGASVYATPDDARRLYPPIDQVTTDSNGRATVWVRLGVVTGAAIVWAARDSDSDSLIFQIEAGAPVGITVLPSDTAVLAGASYAFSVSVADRARNPRPDAVGEVVASSVDPQVARLQDGVISAISVGRAAFDFAAPTGQVRAYVSVVPHAELALVTDAGLVLMETSRGQSQVVTSTTVKCPQWRPDGERILVDGLRLFTVQGEMSRIDTGNGDLVAGCGRFTADGEWIYFSGRLNSEPDTASQVWRVRADGAGLERVIMPPAGQYASNASPSPDGGRIMYHLGGTGPVVFDLATGAADTLAGSHAYALAWSPVDDWVLYTINWCVRVWFIAPRDMVCSTEAFAAQVDGDERKWIRPAADLYPHHFLGGVTWSPDGVWVLGKAFYPDLRLMLVNFATGEALPLNAATRAIRDYHLPAWRPRPAGDH